MPRINLGPVSLDIDVINTILERIEELIKARSPSQIVTLNSLMFNIALQNKEYSRALSKARLSIPDSHGITWAANFLRGPARVQRLTGIDLANRLCSAAAHSGHGVFLLGARPGVAEEAAAELSKSYPGINILGTHHGYFGEKDEKKVIELISSCRPDILLVGLEMPKQELWISKHLSELGVPIVMGVGGSLDVFAGRLKRAPGWVQALRLEWFYRFLQQPWRIKRLLDLPAFVLNVFFIKLSPGKYF